jgi:hypothetical protein
MSLAGSLAAPGDRKAILRKNGNGFCPELQKNKEL